MNLQEPPEVMGQVRAYCSERDMTPSEGEVFVTVGNSQEGITPREIQRTLHMSPRTVSMALNRLSKKSLISREKQGLHYAITNGENSKGLQLYRAIEGRVNPTSEFHL